MPIPEWTEIELEEKYKHKYVDPDTGEEVEVEMEITDKRENPTTDGTPGARIYSYRFKTP